MSQHPGDSLTEVHPPSPVKRRRLEFLDIGTALPVSCERDKKHLKVMEFAQLGGSVGWAIVLCTQGSWVQSPDRARAEGNPLMPLSLSVYHPPPKKNKHILE